jgi:hypothetical protein
MLLRFVLILAAALALEAQQAQQPQQPQPPRVPALADGAPEDVRLPSGKMQREEILKSDYQKSLEDARALAKLADELKADMEKNDYNVLSLATLKRVDEIDKLAKRIHDRLKRF